MQNTCQPKRWGRPSGPAAFSIVEILIVATIIGLIALIAAPHFKRPSETANRNICISNLRQIAAAKAIWAQEQNKSALDMPADTDLFGSTNYLRQKPSCPAGGATIIGNVETVPSCTLSNLGHIYRTTH